MRVLRVLARPPERRAAVRAVVDAVADRGRVATVADRRDHAPGADDATAPGPGDPGSRVPDGVTECHRLDADGWRARGPDRDLVAVLDDLAPRADVAVVEGFPALAVPTVVVGDPDHDGDDATPVAGVPDDDRLATAASPETLDRGALAAAVDDLDPYETLSSLVDRATRSAGAEFSGAVATFTGRVRTHDDPDDPATERLVFEKYDGVADERMDEIERELTAREGVHRVCLHHRTGVIEYGEDIVFVVVLAGHREEAFETVRDGINRLKDEVPLFKKEVTTDEEFWVHERE